MLRIIEAKDPDYAARLRPLCERSAEMPASIEAAARDVIHEVRRRGDAAVRALTERFEKRSIDALELPRATWREQASHVSPGVRLALERAATRVRRFHEREQYAGFELAEDGARVGMRVAPLARVGLYVPGGTARYPSTVIMTAVPAKVAGVREVVMTTPGPSPETLAAALEAGVDRVFVVGGAQAIAALAYGTESVPRVDKIVGPGNAYVAAAKRLVFGDVGIDSIAGPTELVVAADDSVDPAWVAADLLAQAEHDTLAVPILISLGRDVGKSLT
jgi:histidinol dehydrogenase